MKCGKVYKGIKSFDFEDQYKVMKIYEEKIHKWEQYKEVVGFTVDKIKPKVK